MNTLMITAAIAAAALAAPVLASAHPIKTVGDQTQVVVSYADLNLNTADGQARLNARINAAAKTACGAQPDNRDMQASGQYAACVKTSIGAATAAVPAPSLVAGLNGNNG